MRVGGEVVLVDAALSFHQCNSQSAERGVWGSSHPVKTCNLGISHALLPWFKLVMVSPVLVEWFGSNDEKCR